MRRGRFVAMAFESSKFQPPYLGAAYHPEDWNEADIDFDIAKITNHARKEMVCDFYINDLFKLIRQLTEAVFQRCVQCGVKCVQASVILREL